MLKLMYKQETIYNVDWPSPHFPDGTLLLKNLPPFVDRIEWLYDSDAELFTLMCLRQHYQDSITLVLPYVPHARMDRVKNDSELFTLKAFCNAINGMGFSEVIIFDPHSNVTQALLDNVRVLWPSTNIESVHKSLPESDNTTFFFPDEGAMKRYSSMFPGKPYVYGAKDRDWQSGELHGLIINGDESLIKGRDILIVDDICSKGGTFFYSAKALKEKGAKNIYLYVSHCENSIHKGDMIASGLITRVFTTNTIYRPMPRMLTDTTTPITVSHWDAF